MGKLYGRCLTLTIILGCTLVSCGLPPIPTLEPEPTVVAAPVEIADTVTVSVKTSDPVDFNSMVVRVLHTDWVGKHTEDNKFTLRACGEGQSITVWAPGYYIETRQCTNNQSTYEIDLRPYHVNENTYYSWVEARYTGLERNCAQCHTGQYAERLEYIEWQKDGHSTVFTDPYFWNVYLGTDINENYSPETQWEITASSKHTRKDPVLSTPYYGPGFKTDYLSNNGNCAFCHAPASVLAPQTEVDLVPVIKGFRSGVFNTSTEGVNCDACHKVLNVKLDPSGKPYPDKPGVLSFDFIRDEPNSQRLYVGPLTGTDTTGTQINVTCSPVFSKSEFCAPCHYGQFWGTQIYDSYGEWMISPYGKDETSADYKTCQTCHMVANNGQPGGNTNVKANERTACSKDGGMYEDFNHNMLQRDENNLPALVKKAAKVDLETKKPEDLNDRIEVTVRVNNVEAGHKFPTDSPLRHLILYVDVHDKDGTLLPQISGPVIPPWGGVGDQPLDYAGKPGEIYANILMDEDTNQSPTIAYWNQTRPAWSKSDTRLKPHTPETSKYTFALPANGPVIITVRLLYRYAFIDMAELKSWPLSDIEVIEPLTCEINPSNQETWDCSKTSQ